MDNIEKIHIGKVPYHVETKAKTELKKYLGDIKANLESDTADDVMNDIEARMPELLSAHHTKAGDVITHADVQYLKKQLGEPEQFSSDELASKNGPATKKLFRDSDAAVFGGVASGIGKYFNIDANFIRAAFFVLTLFYGIGIILYIFLWVLLPEAKTGADKLLMSGEPVTVANLANYRSTVKDTLSSGPRLIRKIVYKIFRIVALIVTAVVSLFLLSAFGAFSSLFYMFPFRPIVNAYQPDYLFLALLWIGCLTFIGLLVLLTTRIWGYKSFRLNLTAIVLSAVFIISLAASITTGLVVFNHFSDKYANGKDIRSLNVNNETPQTAPTSLNLISDSNLNMTYVISSQPIHATYESFPGMNQPNIAVTNSKGVITVDSTNLSNSAPNCLGELCKHVYLPVHMFLYGPELATVNDNNGATLEINNSNLGDTISLNAVNNSNIQIENSYVGTMNMTAQRGSNISAFNTTAQNTIVNADESSSVSIPITQNLTANIPTICNSNFNNNNQMGPNPPQPPLPPVINLPGYPNHTVINNQAQTSANLNQNGCVNFGF